MGKRKRESTSEESISSEEEVTPQTMKVRINPKKKRRPKVVKTPGAKSDSESEVDDQTPAQKETSSRLKKQKIKARRCTNLVNIRNEFGVATIRKPGLAFKKKNKPGIGKRKKYKKSDLFTVTRNHDRKGLGKLMRPFASGDLLQPRMAFADKYLQSQTRPRLRDPRRHRQRHQRTHGRRPKETGLLSPDPKVV
jgi:hypothetical protein